MQHRIGVAGCLCILFFVSTGPAVAENTSRTQRQVPEIRARRVNPNPPVIDGRLDDPVWSDPNLDFARHFAQRDPDA